MSTGSIRPSTLSIKEVAIYLGLSRATLYRLIQSQELRSVRVGGRRLVRLADIDQFLEQHAE